MRRFLGVSSDERASTVELLCRRFVAESQQAKRFRAHGEKMQYPQFRERLLNIAEDQSRNAQLIGEKITLLGGILPSVPDLPPKEGNDWQNLLSDLEQHRLLAEQLLDDVYRLRPEYPEIAEMLLRIYEDGQRHRSELREMLMRSDPQALLAA